MKSASLGDGTTQIESKNSEEAEERPATAVFVEFVGDRSGSMGSMGSTPSDKTRKLIVDQANDAKASGVPTFFSLTTFDDKMETWMDNVDLRTAKLPSKEDVGCWMEPRGMTRLIDSAVERLKAQNQNVEEYLKSIPQVPGESPPRIVRQFVVLTDGEDNMSKRSAKELHGALTEAKSAFGTVEIFLAANQDAVTGGAAYGFSQERCLTYNPSSIHSAVAIDSTSTLLKWSSMRTHTNMNTNKKTSSRKVAKRTRQDVSFSESTRRAAVSQELPLSFIPDRKHNEYTDGPPCT